MSKKILIEKYPDSLDEPYSNLQPVIDFLKRNGNKPKHNRFVQRPHSNSVFLFRYSLDFEALYANFDFPETIVLTAETDSILDTMNMREIIGGVGC